MQSRLASMMSPAARSTAWALAATAALVSSLLGGIRFPNIWSYSHFLFDYSGGFIKRGLLGATVGHAGVAGMLSYGGFLAFSLAVLAANVVLLWLLINELCRSPSAIAAGCALVFASSFGLVMLAHTIGYAEQLGLLLALSAMRLQQVRTRLVFGLGATAVAVFVHEAIFVIFYPVLFMSLVLDLDGERNRRELLALGLGSAVLVLLVVYLSGATIEVPRAYELYIRLQAQVDPALRKDAFAVLTRSYGENRGIMGAVWSEARFLAALWESLVVTAPAFLLAIYVTVRLQARAGVRPWLTALSVLASISPLLLDLVAADCQRWSALTVTTSFLMLSISYRAYGGRVALPALRYLYPVIALVTAVHLLGDIPLFDGYRVRHPPFREHWEYVRDVLAGEADFPSVPAR